MSDIRLPETIDPVIEWARGMPSEQRIGKAGCAMCPLDVYLVSLGAVEPNVVNCGYYVGGEFIDFPNWTPTALKYIDSSDGADWVNEQPTAGAVLRILIRVKAELEAGS